MVETGECGDVGTRVDVSGPIVMAHALAELRYGIVAHQHESGFKYGHNFAHTFTFCFNFVFFAPHIYFVPLFAVFFL